MIRHPLPPDSKQADLGPMVCLYACTHSGQFTEMESEVLMMIKEIAHMKSSEISQRPQVCTGVRVHLVVCSSSAEQSLTMWEPHAYLSPSIS